MIRPTKPTATQVREALRGHASINGDIHDENFVVDFYLSHKDCEGCRIAEEILYAWCRGGAQ